MPRKDRKKGPSHKSKSAQSKRKSSPHSVRLEGVLSLEGTITWEGTWRFANRANSLINPFTYTVAAAGTGCEVPAHPALSGYHREVRDGGDCGRLTDGSGSTLVCSPVFFGRLKVPRQPGAPLDLSDRDSSSSGPEMTSFEAVRASLSRYWNGTFALQTKKAGRMDITEVFELYFGPSLLSVAQDVDDEGGGAGAAEVKSAGEGDGASGQCVVHGHGKNQFGGFTLTGTFDLATRSLVCEKAYDPIVRPTKPIDAGDAGGFKILADGRRSSKRQRVTTQKLRVDLGADDFNPEKRERGGTSDASGGGAGGELALHAGRGTFGGGGGGGGGSGGGGSHQRSLVARLSKPRKSPEGGGGGCGGNRGDVKGSPPISSPPAARGGGAGSNSIAQRKRAQGFLRTVSDDEADQLEEEEQARFEALDRLRSPKGKGGKGAKKSKQGGGVGGAGSGAEGAARHKRMSQAQRAVVGQRALLQGIDLSKMMATPGICCHVCEVEEQDDDNLLLCCSGCFVTVHQICYGVDTDALIEAAAHHGGKFLCRPCAAGVEAGRASCALCPNPYGAFKRTTDLRWVHLSCAYWVPEAAFMDPRKMEPIGSIDKYGATAGIDIIPRGRFNNPDAPCAICGKCDGVCLPCAAAGCKYAVHPMCARISSVEHQLEHGAPHLAMCMDETGAVVNGFRSRMHCPEHQSEEMERTVAASTVLREKYAQNAAAALSARLEEARRVAEERQRAIEARKKAAAWKKPKTDEGSGQTYEGEYNSKGKRHGHGKCTYVNGHVYEGEWKNGKENGHGVTKDSKGNVVHEGEYQEGRVHGKGTYFFENGDRYVGDFNQATRHGRGCYTEASGATYEGEWREDMRHGIGTFVDADGSSYSGGWQLDFRHGRGTLRLAEGLVYEGGWHKGRMEGRGICTYSEGSRFEGMWKAGKKDGRGTLVFGSNGAVYEGRFRDDQMDGTGTFKMTAITKLENHRPKMGSLVARRGNGAPIVAASSSSSSSNSSRGGGRSNSAASGEEEDTVDDMEVERRPGEEGDKELAWLLPIDSQRDLQMIHRRAGFDQDGL